MKRLSGGSLLLSTLFVSSPLFAQESQPASAPVAPSSAPALNAKPASPALPKAENTTEKPFTLVERPFPEEIHAKRLQFFQLGGYLRLRATRYIRPDLGLTAANGNQAIGNGAPVFGLLEPLEANNQNIDNGFGGAASDGYRSSNLRLRLDPTFYVSETVRIMLQADVLDNVILGSGAASFPETGGLGTADQDTPDILGSSALFSTDSFRIKRAWGEAQIPFGEIYFGRMGWHFGLGLFANDGNNIDADFGDTVDRVAVSFKLANLLVTGAYDFASSGLSASHAGDNGLGQAFDVSQLDDIRQYVVSAQSIFTREEEEKRRKRGEWVLQYGGQGVLRDQDATSEFITPGTPFEQSALADRNATSATLNVWGKLVYKNIHLEAEAVGTYAALACVLNDNPGQNTDQCQGRQDADAITVTAGGFVVRGDVSLSQDQWKLGGELGAASADENTSFSLALQQQGLIDPTQDTNLTAFLFDRDFRVDQLLFRELLGTVTGAAYLKGTASYAPSLPGTQKLRFQGAAIYSTALAASREDGSSANAPLSGQSALGLELDLDAEYRTGDNFFGGFTWGILFPGEGLNAFANNGQLLDAQTAQSLRLRLGVNF